MINLIAYIVLACIVAFFAHSTNKLTARVGELEAQVKHLLNAVSYETKLYDTQVAYEKMYEERIEEMKEELASKQPVRQSESTPADILMNGIYNIPESDNHEVRTKRADREVSA